MPYFSKQSREKLDSCHSDIINLFDEIIKKFDCKILYGHRSSKSQFELFKKGRIKQNGIWVIDNILEVTTYKDGIKNKSKHNILPSDAVDITPYPIDFKDINRIYYFAGYVLECSSWMNIKIRWGGDWDSDTEIKDQTFNDLLHFERI